MLGPAAAAGQMITKTFGLVAVGCCWSRPSHGGCGGGHSVAVNRYRARRPGALSVRRIHGGIVLMQPPSVDRTSTTISQLPAAVPFAGLSAAHGGVAAANSVIDRFPDT